MQKPADASRLASLARDGVERARSLDAGASMLSAEVQAFLVDRVARGLSGRTVDWYLQKLSAFASFAAQERITSVVDLTPSHIRSYLLALARDHTPGGVHGFYRALRALVNWYATEYEPPGWRNPLRKVRAPKVPQELLEPVPLSDLRAMFAVCPEDTELGCRDRAILLALLDTGCRAQEFLEPVPGRRGPGHWQLPGAAGQGRQGARGLPGRDGAGSFARLPRLPRHPGPPRSALGNPRWRAPQL